MKESAKEPFFRNAYPCRSCIRCRCCPCICPPGGVPAPDRRGDSAPANGALPTVLLVVMPVDTLLYRGWLVRRRVKAKVKGAKPSPSPPPSR